MRYKQIVFYSLLLQIITCNVKITMELVNIISQPVKTWQILLIYCKNFCQ